MDKLNETLKGLEYCVHQDPAIDNCSECPGDHCHVCTALELLKAQEPRVLQIKEMAFLEIAVFIETNGTLEGKGTDLFLAIPYIYAVSQNMLDGYIAFVDGNTDVYDLQAIDYGKSWRCWTSRPTDEQRKETPWND